MKKIIPFKKEIIFNDNLSEITSISLEHNLRFEDNNVFGNFYINGEYRMAENSINTESFSYDLPFEINLDERYLLKNSIIDVDDFYYEIINEKILKVNIEILIDNIEEVEIIEDIFEERKEEIETINNKVEILNLEKIKDVKNDEVKKEDKRCIEEELPSVFDNMDSSETYRSYTIYIVRENDSLESILTKYNVTKEQLDDYNDLKEIKIGDKIIIPNV